MPSPAYSIIYSAVLSTTASDGLKGDVLIPSTVDGRYVKATTANRGSRRATGIALSDYASGGVVDIQQTGQVATDVTGFTAAASSWVRTSMLGRLEKVTPSAGDDLLGKTDTDGRLFLSSGIWDSSNSAPPPFVAPTGTGIITGTSGTLDASAAPVGAGIMAFLATPSGANLATALTSALPTTDGGTGLAAIGSSLQILRTNTAASALEYATLSTAISTARVTPLDANHIHAWELDDASGDFVDTGSSVSKVNLTATTGGNAPLYRRIGPVGYAAAFGRSAAATTTASCRASTLISAITDIPTLACSMEIWVKCDDLGDAACHLMGATSTASYDWDVVLSPSANTISTDLRATTTATLNIMSGLKVLWGTWHYVVVTYNGIDLVMYVDGEVVGSQSRAGAIVWTNGTTPTLAIGKDLATNGQFIGQLSRFRLSNLARTGAEILAVYQKGMGY